MLGHLTYDDAPRSDESKYFEILKADLIRKYGDKKGTRLAGRWWDIKDKTDTMFQEERTKIVMGWG